MSYAMRHSTVGTVCALALAIAFWHVVPSWAASRKCVASGSAGCATCDSTKDDSGQGQYQCRPAALPTGVIYGTCPALGGKCTTGSDIPQQTCGTSDWTCDDPPVSIDSSTACSEESPAYCKP
jgi:hypothetical protein